MNDQSYVPAHLAIEAMRVNGYRNTAYAVAELIDNSIEAEASLIQLLCAEKEDQLPTRTIRKLYQIAVLDNGIGMDEQVLKMALQFGNGTRLSRSARTGIGRFGMGLPASSISQCKRVDVWSWQNGIENALHTYLDVDEIKRGLRQTVPEPDKEPIPSVWLQAGLNFGKSGTLVVWSKLDRLLWSKASTLIDNSELLIGRLYRKFLNEQKTKIRLLAFNYDDPSVVSVDRYAKPNDPCYLMKNTSCPPPFDKEPMFEKFGGDDVFESKFTINFNGANHDVIVRLSYAKDEARAHDNAGNTPHGRHAAKNIGISIVRAGRELELDQSLVIQYDPRERWWGIEVEFPPALDELMGVTNNKQSARNFADIMTMVERDIENLMKSGKTLNQIKTELEEEGDPRAPLIEVAIFIKNQLSIIRNLLKEQGRGKRTTRYIDITPEKTATRLTDERKKMGFIGESDKYENKSPTEKEEEIKRELMEVGITEEDAERLAATTVTNNLKYLFAEAPFESDAFFIVSPRGGTINIILNTRHPAFENLVEVLEKNPNVSVYEERLNKAAEGLKLLLMAWARYEDELPDGPMKEHAQDARKDWGRIARIFLRKY